jgi:hypothetical protein
LLGDETYAEARSIAPGWDIYQIEADWCAWCTAEKIELRNPGRHSCFFAIAGSRSVQNLVFMKIAMAAHGWSSSRPTIYVGRSGAPQVSVCRMQPDIAPPGMIPASGLGVRRRLLQ